MTPETWREFVTQGGALGVAGLLIWGLLTGKIVSRREFDRLDERYSKMESLNELANNELRQQAATLARTVEMVFQQQRTADDIRRDISSKGGGPQ